MWEVRGAGLSKRRSSRNRSAMVMVRAPSMAHDLRIGLGLLLRLTVAKQPKTPTRINAS